MKVGKEKLQEAWIRFKLFLPQKFKLGKFLWYIFVFLAILALIGPIVVQLFYALAI